MLIHRDALTGKHLATKELQIALHISGAGAGVRGAERQRRHFSRHMDHRRPHGGFIDLTNLAIGPVKLETITIKRDVAAGHHQARRIQRCRIVSQCRRR